MAKVNKCSVMGETSSNPSSRELWCAPYDSGPMNSWFSKTFIDRILSTSFSEYIKYMTLLATSPGRSDLVPDSQVQFDRAAGAVLTQRIR
jgi:hypothetical protein